MDILALVFCSYPEFCPRSMQNIPSAGIAGIVDTTIAYPMCSMQSHGYLLYVV